MFERWDEPAREPSEGEREFLWMGMALGYATAILGCLVGYLVGLIVIR